MGKVNLNRGNGLSLAVIFGMGLLLWFSPAPEGLDERGWHMLAIFVATIMGVVMKPLPMGAIAILALGVSSTTGVLSLGQALGGFSESAVWLIVVAFFIARSFVKTGLGTRVAYYFVRMFGRKTLGLSYSLIASELVLAPAIPSTTARNGGIIYPIVNSLSRALNSRPNHESARDFGAFLTLTSFHGCVITGAMFLTAMAGNPLVVKLAEGLGVTITWGSWALAAIVPGLVSLIVIPLVIYVVSPPRIKTVEGARELADEHLNKMGKVNRQEWILAGVFVGLVGLWIFGERLWGISSASAGLLGLGALLLTNVLSWDDVLSEKGAWDTFIWFSVLVSMAGYLNTFGVISYFSEFAVSGVKGLDWRIAFLILSLIYFYSHYAFASNTAHIGAMYGAMLSVSIMLGTPSMLAALLLAYFSNLFGGLTHYSTSPAPVLFGAGYVGIKEWWRVGFIVSVVNIVIWTGVGGLWWKFLGYW